MSKKTLIYIDPGYMHKSGHYYHMAKCLKDACKKKKIEVLHFVSENVSEKDADENNLFREFFYKPILNVYWEHKKNLNDFYCKFEKILENISKRVVDEKSKGEEREYSIFMYTGHPYHFPIIAYLINKYRNKIPGLRAYIDLFYLNENFCLDREEKKYVRQLRLISNLIEKIDKNNLLNIGVDSERTQKIYQPFFKKKIQVFSLPIQDFRKNKNKNNKNKIVILYSARMNDVPGLKLVYNSYKYFIKNNLSDKVKFKIKIHSDEPLRNYSLKNDLANKKGLEFFDDFFVGKQYESFFDSCDILLLPYSKKDFPCRTSGNIVDALFKNKIILVPEDTWMGDQLKKYGSGETFISENQESFSKSLKKIVDNYDFYYKNRGRNVKEFIRGHSPEFLLEELFDNRGVLKDNIVRQKYIYKKNFIKFYLKKLIKSKIFKKNKLLLIKKTIKRLVKKSIQTVRIEFKLNILHSIGEGLKKITDFPLVKDVKKICKNKMNKYFPQVDKLIIKLFYS